MQFASLKFIQSTFGKRLGVLLKKNSARMPGLSLLRVGSCYELIIQERGEIVKVAKLYRS